MNREHDKNFRVALEDAIASFGIEGLSKSQLEQLDRHYFMMCQWNQHINLTRITEPEEAARFHYAESLWGARFIGDALTILDIGSGGGFPGIPLAVTRPDVKVTAIEANQKKALFLSEVKDALGLANLRVIKGRIEDFDWTDQHLLTSRALDQGEKILASVARRLRPPQRLMLYCATELADRLAGHCAEGYVPQIHAVPQADSRVIALFQVRNLTDQPRAD